MAKLLNAIVKYGPRLELNPTVQLDKVAELMAMRTGLHKSQVMMVLQEQSETILFFTKGGTSVKLPGIGIFSPSIERDGNININFRADSELKVGINTTNIYEGEILNRDHIGWTDQQYKEQWDKDNPSDPLNL